MFLEYGKPSPISLTPCTSTTATVACAAVATDAEDGDLTSLIRVTDVTPCTGTNRNACIRCRAEQLTLGTCLPGTYTLRWVARRAGGRAGAMAWPGLA